MISCTEFIPAYSELFTYLEDQYGREEVDRFWKYLFVPDGKGIPLIGFVEREASDDARHVGSLGAGYSVKCGASDFFVDLAYQQLIKKNKEIFTLYSDTDIAAPVGESESSNWKLLLSLGFRF